MNKDIDGGYAWVILACCFVSQIICGGSCTVYGQFYLELDTTFHAHREWLMTVVAVQCFTLYIACLVSGWLCSRFSVRKVGAVGVLLCTAGFVISAFSQHLMGVIFGYGFVLGLGLAFHYMAAVTILQLYFHKKRSLANGISGSGIGFGVMVYAPATRMLVEQYGWRGAMLLLGALYLQCLLAVALMREPTRENSNPASVQMTDIFSSLVSLTSKDDCYKTPGHDETKTPLHATEKLTDVVSSTVSLTENDDFRNNEKHEKTKRDKSVEDGLLEQMSRPIEPAPLDQITDNLSSAMDKLKDHEDAQILENGNSVENKHEIDAPILEKDKSLENDHAVDQAQTQMNPQSEANLKSRENGYANGQLHTGDIACADHGVCSNGQIVDAVRIKELSTVEKQRNGNLSKVSERNGDIMDDQSDRSNGQTVDAVSVKELATVENGKLSEVPYDNGSLVVKCPQNLDFADVEENCLNPTHNGTKVLLQNQATGQMETFAQNQSMFSRIFTSLKLYLNLYVLLFFVASSSLSVSSGIPYNFVPVKCVGDGLTASDAALIISCMGFGDMLGRWVFGVIGLRVNLTVLYAITCAGVGGGCFLIAFTHSFAAITASALLFTFVQGGAFTVGPQAYIHYVGVENFSRVYGFIMMGKAVGYGSAGPLGAYVSDLYGSGSVVFFVVGFFALAAGCIACLILALGTCKATAAMRPTAPRTTSESESE